MTAPTPAVASVPPPSRWSWGRIALWSFAAALSGLVFGPAFVASFRPPPGMVSDFVQEWLSAKDFVAGRSVYSPLTESLRIHTGMMPDRDLLAWNAHPPASVLAVLPFAGLDYRTAHLAWNLLTFPLFVAAVVLAIRELGMPVRPASAMPVVALTVACYPLYYQLTQGQWNCVLAFLVTLGWVGDRRGWPTSAGAAIGLAAGVKLFPAALFLYFLMAGRWRSLGVGIGVFLAVNGIALTVFGVGAFRTYITEVVPSVAEYRGSWQNLSADGFLTRTFGGHVRERVTPLVAAPEVGRLIAAVVAVLIAVAVGSASRPTRRRDSCDAAFAVAVVGMLLASPVTWSHYLPIAAMPVGLAWMRLPRGPLRWLLTAALVALWLPTYYFPSLAIGPEQTARLIYGGHDPLPPAVHLTLVSLPFYALVTLFGLLLWLAWREGERPSRWPRSPRRGPDGENP